MRTFGCLLALALKALCLALHYLWPLFACLVEYSPSDAHTTMSNVYDDDDD